MATASLSLLLATATVAGPCITCFFPGTGLHCHPQTVTLFTHHDPGFPIHLGKSWAQACASTDTPAVCQGLHGVNRNFPGSEHVEACLLSVAHPSVAL